MPEYPDADTSILGWLDSPPAGSLTIDERCRRLAPALVPERWEHVGKHFARTGRSHALVKAWAPGWRCTEAYDPKGPKRLAECFDIHCELEIGTYPPDRKTATCHLHYETNPYYSQKELANLVPEAQLAEFCERREQFRIRVHKRLWSLEGLPWESRNNLLQIARFVVPMHSAVTVATVRDVLKQRLPLIAAIVDEVRSESA
jgi:hypothetical protein